MAGSWVSFCLDLNLPDKVANTILTMTVAPQGKVLSPVLLTLHPAEYTHSQLSSHLQNIFDDSALVGLPNQGIDKRPTKGRLNNLLAVVMFYSYRQDYSSWRNYHCQVRPRKSVCLCGEGVLHTGSAKGSWNWCLQPNRWGFGPVTGSLAQASRVWLVGWELEEVGVWEVPSGPPLSLTVWLLKCTNIHPLRSNRMWQKPLKTTEKR